MLRLASVLPWAALTAGCGQKGPLFHPPEPAGKKTEKEKKEKSSAAPPVPGPRLT